MDWLTIALLIVLALLIGLVLVAVAAVFKERREINRRLDIYVKLSYPTFWRCRHCPRWTFSVPPKLPLCKQCMVLFREMLQEVA